MGHRTYRLTVGWVLFQLSGITLLREALFNKSSRPGTKAVLPPSIPEAVPSRRPAGLFSSVPALFGNVNVQAVSVGQSGASLGKIVTFQPSFPMPCICANNALLSTLYLGSGIAC